MNNKKERINMATGSIVEVGQLEAGPCSLVCSRAKKRRLHRGGGLPDQLWLGQPIQALSA
jgi:hypothetical protein